MSPRSASLPWASFLRCASCVARLYPYNKSLNVECRQVYHVSRHDRLYKLSTFDVFVRPLDNPKEWADAAFVNQGW